ncbi:hypothetical protein ACFC6L_35545 [Kitasatospora phosalacinea]|uniref:hypothetical protein n=1 Tax=Kitasatospora phosalacinea TaxID=2065 RepID=UPI0035E0347A
MPDHYPYRVLTPAGDPTLLWRPGENDEPDAFLTGPDGSLLRFPDPAAAEAHCLRHGLDFFWGAGNTLDLAAARHWTEAPHLQPPASCRLLLDTWNFFTDLPGALPPEGPVHDGAYDKLFGGTALHPTSDPASWTPAETAAVRALFAAGFARWDRLAGPAPH